MPAGTSEYNRDQWLSLTTIRGALEQMPTNEIDALRASLVPYLEFRRDLAAFHDRHFQQYCHQACFETGLSACCGFESIITFFADQVITCLVSDRDDRDLLVRILERPNTTGKCVFLGARGCQWRLPPISCAMFYCEPARKAVLANEKEAVAHFEELCRRDKQFTEPLRAVLFDDLERHFRHKGLATPHMFYHFSPGLLRLKAKAGILDETLRIHK
jgi:hypothetical protein